MAKSKDLIDFSDAHYLSDGRIDCIWHHPVHGDIPFTADPNDVEEHGRMIFDFLKDKAAPYEGGDS